MNYPKEVINGWKMAIEARERAYAPYSNFKVGSAVKMKGQDEIMVGCNVENASYGGSMCAERNAIWGSISKYGKASIEWLIVVADTQRPTAPCGLCRQVMSEFTQEDYPVYLCNLEEIQQEVPFSELLPYPFDTLNS